MCECGTLGEVIPRGGTTLGKCKVFGNKEEKVSLAAAYAVSPPREWKRTLCCKALGRQHNHGHASTTVPSLSTGRDSREDGRLGGGGAQQQPGG